MNKVLTCIVCPIGCQLEVELDGTEVRKVSGNSCKRGEAYAMSELTNPQRIVTSTVKTVGGEILPVKTSMGIPKKLIFECMDEINRIRLENREYSVGDVVVHNVLGTGADVVVCANSRKR